MKPAPVLSCIALAVSGILSAELHAEGFDPFVTQRGVSPAVTGNVIPREAEHAPCTSHSVETAIGLMEVVERALCNNPQTRQAWENAKAQAAQLGISESAYLPAVTASYSATKGPNSTAVKDIPQLSYDVHTTTRDGSVNLVWTLFDFGLRAANVESARQLLAAANATQDLTLQKVFLAAAQAYYDLLAVRAAFHASEEAENAARESFTAAEAKYKLGVGALADKLQAQTNLAQATLTRVKADGDLKNAEGVLAVAMGLKANTAFTLQEENTALPDTSFAHSVDALIEQAIRTHPSLAAARAQLKAAQANIDAVEAEGLPTIALTGAIERNDQLGQYPRDTFLRNRSIGVQVKIPLFEGFGRSYRVRAARAQAAAKAADVANTEQQVSLEVWKNYQALQTETEDLKATGDLLQSAELSFKVAQGRYKAGVGNILELLNAQSALANARQQQIQAVSNWRTARLSLAASLGQLGWGAINR